MSRFVAFILLVSVLNAPAFAAESGRVISTSSSPGRSSMAPARGAIAASATREAGRLAHSMAPEPRTAQATPREAKPKGWIARHPALVGALGGFGVGCTVGASHVGGSADNFFNTLDEAACLVVGGIGLGVGAFVGLLVK